MWAPKITKSCVITFALVLGSSVAGPLRAQSDSSAQSDNTAVNKQDRNSGQATADQQKMNPADRQLTQKIRRSIMADKTLSTYAHNVKIISQDGVVTLKGPVRSDDELHTVMAKASDAAGSPDKIVNQMTVQPPKQ